MTAGADAAALFEQHRDSLLRYLCRSVRDRQDAEDLLQETFTRVVGSGERYNAAGRDVAWLFRIARNLVVDRARASRARVRTTSMDNDTRTLGRVARFEPARAPIQQLALELDEALLALPHDDRDAFLLREAGGLGYEDISRLIGASPDAVRNRIYRARAALRRGVVSWTRACEAASAIGG